MSQQPGNRSPHLPSEEAPLSATWERIQDVFLGAAAEQPNDRSAYLDAACGTDDVLRREVESLLDHDLPETELQTVFAAAAAQLVEDDPMMGTRIGAYRVTKELGHGGMGTVYLAVRADDVYEKQVAIKVVRKGMDTEVVLDRFRHERQILANLEHPYIARLIDGGTTHTGQPFLVMEYVEGQPVDVFCRERKLNIEQRCLLFLRVCKAVIHAHRNLVVHRDLKPNNIFVTGTGMPKLLDFGVAKLLDAEMDAGLTVPGLTNRPLTPDYASPEQLMGLPVTTAADVYSLGAVLYELLTGVRAQHITSRSPVDLQRAICETEVTRPSSHAPQIGRDLDNIVMMALSKDVTRRYPTVDEFAADLMRYLDGLPVVARKSSFVYRAHKFIRRNRIGLGLAAIVVVSLLGGVIVAMSEAREAQIARGVAENERQAAERERARAEERSRQAEAARVFAEQEHATSDQMRGLAEQEAGHAREAQARAEQRLVQIVEQANSSLFDVHDAITTLPGATPVRRAVVTKTLQFLERTAKESGTDDRVAYALGSAYYKLGDLQGYPNLPSLGDTKGALESYHKGSVLLEPLLEKRSKDADILMTWTDLQHHLCDVLFTVGQLERGLAVCKAALPHAQTLAKLRPTDPWALFQEGSFHEAMGSALRTTNTAAAFEHIQRFLEIATPLVERYPDELDLQWQLSSGQSEMASVLLRRQDLNAAVMHQRESVRLRENLVARKPNDIRYRRSLMLTYGQLAGLLGGPFYSNLGDVAGSRTYYKKALDIATNINGSDPENRVGRYDLAAALLRTAAVGPLGSESAERLSQLRRAETILKGLLKDDPGPVKYQTTLSMVCEYIARVLVEDGHADQAVPEYHRSLEYVHRAAASAPDDFSLIAQMQATEQALAQAYAGTGDNEKALEWVQSYVGRARGSLTGPDTRLRTRRLAIALGAASDLHRRIGDCRAARGAAEESLGLWKTLQQGGGNPALAPEASVAESVLRNCAAPK